MKPISQSSQLKMNGVPIEPAAKVIISTALELVVIPDCKYRSKENLIETLIAIQGLVIDWLNSQKKSTRKYEKEQADLRLNTNRMSRDQVVTMVYNKILQSENFGLLRGFGLSNNFKDKLYINPETKTILKPF